MISFFKMELGTFLIHKRNWFIVRFMSRLFFNCDVSINTMIDKSVRFNHEGMNVLIADGVIIEENCTISHGVLIGCKGGNTIFDVPVIKKNVHINPYSIIVGGITIGENSIIGVRAFIDKDVPPNSVVWSKQETVMKKRTKNQKSI